MQTPQVFWTKSLIKAYEWVDRTGFVGTCLLYTSGVVATSDDEAKILLSPRSSITSRQEEFKDRLQTLADVLGFDAKFEYEYPGWSYACLLYTSGKTMAELTPEEKNATSHRFHALEDLSAQLTTVGGAQAQEC